MAGKRNRRQICLENFCSGLDAETQTGTITGRSLRKSYGACEIFSGPPASRALQIRGGQPACADCHWRVGAVRNGSIFDHGAARTSDFGAYRRKPTQHGSSTTERTGAIHYGEYCTAQCGCTGETPSRRTSFAVQPDAVPSFRTSWDGRRGGAPHRCQAWKLRCGSAGKQASGYEAAREAERAHRAEIHEGRRGHFGTGCERDPTGSCFGIYQRTERLSLRQGGHRCPPRGRVGAWRKCAERSCA